MSLRLPRGRVVLGLAWMMLTAAGCGDTNDSGGGGSTGDAGTSTLNPSTLDASVGGASGGVDSGVDGSASVHVDAGSADGGAGDAAGLPLRKRRYLCINGAGVGADGGRDTGGNPWMEQLCASLGSQVIQDCGSGTCFYSFSFEVLSTAARRAVLAALDTNKDGSVTPADLDQDLVLLGYSWGGTNVRDLASHIESDSAYDPVRRQIALMVALDPYRPLASLKVPGNVKKFVEFRHSNAPADDCSRIKVKGIQVSGPYLGFPPQCTGTTQCTDYDYSLATAVSFPNKFTAGGTLGARIDHCDVVNVAAPAVLALLRGAAYAPLPPTVPVATY